MAGFIPLILIFGLMYVLMIRPQQRKVKEQQALVSSISAGDEVVLNSGIFGRVNEVDGDDLNILWIEVFDGIELKVLRSAVDRRFNEPVSVDDADEVDEADEA
ncbi:MAG: preprotein translocase subunit YajC [Acidimicrobiales bacterium]|nr:preprotein translocase subunit YajC [Acidimicrobiales bacterium]